MPHLCHIATALALLLALSLSPGCQREPDALERALDETEQLIEALDQDDAEALCAALEAYQEEAAERRHQVIAEMQDLPAGDRKVQERRHRDRQRRSLVRLAAALARARDIAQSDDESARCVESVLNQLAQEPLKR